MACTVAVSTTTVRSDLSLMRAWAATVVSCVAAADAEAGDALVAVGAPAGDDFVVPAAVVFGSVGGGGHPLLRASGEPMERQRQARLAAGVIRYPASVVDGLRDSAAKLGIPFDLVN